MATSEDELRRIRNNQRRQAYYRRRRTIQRMEREGPALQLDRMSVAAVVATLEECLHQLLNEMALGASPEHYQMTRTAWDCYSEIISRGEVLRLLD